MNRTKLLHIVLSIALIASLGGNFYSLSQAKALSNALYDSTKQVEALTQELEQSQLALEAAVVAEVKVPGYKNSLDGMTLEEIMAYGEQLKDQSGGSKPQLPDGTKRYAWDVGNVASNKYKVNPAFAPKSTAQYHHEYRQKFNIPDSVKLDIELDSFNDKDGNGIMDYIEEGRVYDARVDADPQTQAYRVAMEVHRKGDAMLKAEAEGCLDEYLAEQLKSRVKGE